MIDIPASKLYDFLRLFNSSSNVAAFIIVVATIHIAVISLCLARAILDQTTAWPWAIVMLNILNFIILTVDARMHGLSHPVMAFVVLISESLCMAGNILVCFIVSTSDCPLPFALD